ncbi:MAG: S8 family serine peptidase [Planctomycetota bacterium]
MITRSLFSSAATTRVLLGAAGLLACIVPHTLGADVQPIDVPPGAEDGLPDLTRAHDPTSVLVTFTAEADEPIIEALMQIAGTEVEWRSTLVPGMARLDLEHPVRETILTLHRFGRYVRDIEPDYMVSLLQTPNDPEFAPVQWGLENTQQFISGIRGFNDADIDALEAWNIYTGDPNFVVAVVDQGTDITHPDIDAQIWTNPGESGLDGMGNDKATNGIDDDSNGYVDDVHGWDFTTQRGDTIDDQNDFPVHGTLVSGIIGAETDNGIGIAGVCWDVQIMPLKFIDFTGEGPTGLAIEALEYAINQGVTLSNHSWGTSFASTHLSAAMTAARMAGHIVVAAAGNAGTPVAAFPAGFGQDNIISVASIDNRDNLAASSQYNAATVDLGAPGVGIFGPVPPIGNPSLYGFTSGTSFAAPHVTGTAALLWGLRPDWTYQQVIAQILGSTRPIQSLVGKTVTEGALNAGRALVTAILPPSIQHTPGPSEVLPAVDVVFSAVVNAGDDEIITPPALNYRVNCGPWVSVPLDGQGTATVPAPYCGDVISYYFSVESASAGVVTLPDQSQSEAPYEFRVGQRAAVFADSFAADLGWARDDDIMFDASTGLWERGTPSITSAQPGAGVDDDFCLVTDGQDNGFVAAFDVDGGTTAITSPPIDLTNVNDAVLRFDRWYFNAAGTAPNADIFVTQLSGDGGTTWVDAEVVGPAGDGTSGGWITTELRVNDHVTVTGPFHVRFLASDLGTGSLVEAAIDRVVVEGLVCTDTVGGIDFNGDGATDSGDVSAFRTALDADDPSADHNRDGTIDAFDGASFYAATAGVCD